MQRFAEMWTQVCDFEMNISHKQWFETRDLGPENNLYFNLKEISDSYQNETFWRGTTPPLHVNDAICHATAFRLSLDLILLKKTHSINLTSASAALGSLWREKVMSLLPCSYLLNRHMFNLWHNSNSRKFSLHWLHYICFQVPGRERVLGFLSYNS